MFYPVRIIFSLTFAFSLQVFRPGRYLLLLLLAHFHALGLSVVEGNICIVVTMYHQYSMILYAAVKMQRKTNMI